MSTQSLVNILFDDHKGYMFAYLPQAVPVLGAIVSIPTALVSGCHAIYKLAQAAFERYYYGNPWYSQNLYQNDPILNPRKCTPLEDAGKLGVIFANNLLNLCTFGIFNSVLVMRVCCGLPGAMGSAMRAG